MKQEYSFTLTVPFDDIEKAERLLEQAREQNTRMRISRKPDKAKYARFYISFPFSGARPDLSFQEWFVDNQDPTWDLFGPTYGRWGLC